ncbi:hypothetical protein DSO57_1012194 [Entomophthora muscae]|uniref:Uncharacterized protein n=1 Tax=Entomophthora muscae TaxID=34485 RepID=A0ACC2UF01_9FUNG|nr:hypothetical protein DSO57_1012194 [Entomophthora muscae]
MYPTRCPPDPMPRSMPYWQTSHGPEACKNFPPQLWPSRQPGNYPSPSRDHPAKLPQALYRPLELPAPGHFTKYPPNPPPANIKITEILLAKPLSKNQKNKRGERESGTLGCPDCSKTNTITPMYFFPPPPEPPNHPPPNPPARQPPPPPPHRIVGFHGPQLWMLVLAQAIYILQLSVLAGPHSTAGLPLPPPYDWIPDIKVHSNTFPNQILKGFVHQHGKGGKERGSFQ